MGRIPGYLEWDDDSLTPGQKKEGGLHPNLYDREGNLKGSARFLPGSDDDENSTQVELFEIDGDLEEVDGVGSGLGAAAIFAGLALIGVTVGAVASASREKKSRRELEWRLAEARQDTRSTAISPRMAAPAGWYDDGSGRMRWWDGQDWTDHFYSGTPRAAAPAGWYDDGSGRQRWWDGQEWTAHYQGGQQAVSSWPQALSGRASAATPMGSDVAREMPVISMSSAEWQERVRTMLLARAISDVQWKLLSNARIEDADGALLEWQTELRRLTPQEFSDHIDYMLATNTDARSRALESATAGWYDDGSGRQRWWDGQEWTEQFEAEEVRALPGSYSSTSAGWYDDGSGRQRWWDGRRWSEHLA